jgi:hypothetical protein
VNDDKQEESDKLKQLVKENPKEGWVQIAKLLGTGKTGAQCCTLLYHTSKLHMKCFSFLVLYRSSDSNNDVDISLTSTTLVKSDCSNTHKETLDCR